MRQRDCPFVSFSLAVELGVLLVVDGLEPLVGAVLAGEAKGEVAEPAVGLGTVPVLDVGRDLHDVAGLEAARGLALLLVPALALDAGERLEVALANVAVRSLTARTARPCSPRTACACVSVPRRSSLLWTSPKTSLRTTEAVSPAPFASVPERRVRRICSRMRLSRCIAFIPALPSSCSRVTRIRSRSVLSVGSSTLRSSLSQ